MFGYATLYHGVKTRDQFDHSSHPVFVELLTRIAGSERIGACGVLSSKPSSVVRKFPEYNGIKTVPYSASPFLNTPNKILEHAPSDGTMPGEFAFGNRLSYEAGCSVNFSATVALDGVSPRTFVSADYGHNLSALAAYIDQTTMMPVEGVPLAVRIQDAVAASEQLFDTDRGSLFFPEGGGPCFTVSIAPTTLAFVRAPNAKQTLSLFVVWIHSSLYLIWHSNRDLVIEAILSLNGADFNQYIKRISHTIGYSEIPVNGTYALHIQAQLDAFVDDTTRTKDAFPIRMSAAIGRLLHRIENGKADRMKMRKNIPSFIL